MFTRATCLLAVVDRAVELVVGLLHLLFGSLARGEQVGANGRQDADLHVFVRETVPVWALGVGHA